MEEFQTLINNSTPVIVDFYADWCAPCKMMAPILKQVKTKLGNKVRIIKIDVEKNQALANNYRIQSVPAIKIFQNGMVKWSGNGVVQSDQLISIVTTVSQ